MSDDRYWLAFNLVNGIGPAKLRALLDRFGDLEAAWHAPEAALSAIGIDRRALAQLAEMRRTLDLERQLARVRASGARLVHWESADYPRSLVETPNAPPLLFVKGELLDTDSWAVAVVGTRRLTSYGRQMTHEIVAALAARGITIVSGLARGIDAVAHKTALDVGGRTIAVLGSGLDEIYPPENRRLADAIAAGRGAVVSEYALGVRPEAKNFPPRNRIISGLSLGVIVVEAGLKSGALITADFAMEQGRELFALPGNVTSPMSAGPNRLIQNGARLITSAEDVLRELNLDQVEQQQAVQMMLPESAEEALLLTHLTREPTHIDELSRASGLPAALVSSTLTLMELKGMVQQVGGMQYAVMREASASYGVDGSAESPPPSA